MKVCKICGIDKPAEHFHKDRQKADGLAPYCKPCFIAKQREYAGRPPRKQDTAPSGHKTCQRCKTVRPVTQFSASSTTFDHVSKRCKVCDSEQIDHWRRNNLDRAAALQKKWRRENPARSADYFLRKNYGLPLGAYDEMLAAQKGICAICGTDQPGGQPRKDGAPARFHVDHCHDTNVVRGLLCHHCNVGIGNLKHDPCILLKAIDYVRQPKLVE